MPQKVSRCIQKVFPPEVYTTSFGEDVKQLYTPLLYTISPIIFMGLHTINAREQKETVGVACIKFQDTHWFRNVV